jgi:tetratricopeptide (TPR) repeat protein
MRAALEQRPADPLCHLTLGTVLGTAGELDAAADAFRHAAELKPDLAGAWYNLGVLLVRSMRNTEAASALRRALVIAPQDVSARVQLADLLRASGNAKEAETEYRSVLSTAPFAGMAWWGLADLRTIRQTDDDIVRMRAGLRDPRASGHDRVAMGFALARALDQNGRYAESLTAIGEANAIARRHRLWDATAFSAGIASVRAAFDPAPAAAPDPDLGSQAVFVVSLPRSGSTLIEQILASHPEVEGAGELPDLPLVITEECRRRQAPLAQWARAVTPEDWRRLGQRYLERTARWTRERPRFVDKLPSNWQYIGAIRAMLPGARVVVARRDPLETCFSCYRQFLNDNEYTRTFPDLAAYWRDFDRMAREAATLHSRNVCEFAHHELVRDPQARIRGLLDFCGLAFDPACLQFHRTEREVRSPSAMQVREPLRSDTQHAARYGALLDPLRVELALPPFATS